VVRRGDRLEAFVVKVGKRVYSLGVLLKNRHGPLGEDGSEGGGKRPRVAWVSCRITGRNPFLLKGGPQSLGKG